MSFFIMLYHITLNVLFDSCWLYSTCLKKSRSITLGNIFLKLVFHWYMFLPLVGAGPSTLHDLNLVLSSLSKLSLFWACFSYLYLFSAYIHNDVVFLISVFIILDLANQDLGLINSQNFLSMFEDDKPFLLQVWLSYFLQFFDLNFRFGPYHIV